LESLPSPQQNFPLCGRFPPSFFRFKFDFLPSLSLIPFLKDLVASSSDSSLPSDSFLSRFPFNSFPSVLLKAVSHSPLSDLPPFSPHLPPPDQYICPTFFSLRVLLPFLPGSVQLFFFAYRLNLLCIFIFFATSLLFSLDLSSFFPPVFLPAQPGFLFMAFSFPAFPFFR